MREIRALGRVDHDHLIKIHTAGSLGDVPFYVMELVEGTDLRHVWNQMRQSPSKSMDETAWDRAVTTACEQARSNEKPMAGSSASHGSGSRSGTRSGSRSGSRSGTRSATPDREIPVLANTSKHSHVQRVVELIRQAADALDALHTAGIIHRDVKPGNILVTPDGRRAIVADLGLAQLDDEETGSLMCTRQWVGTLRYASPEQILAARRVDRRTDIYGLGATMWELLTLRTMFGVTDETPPGQIMEKTEYRGARTGTQI